MNDEQESWQHNYFNYFTEVEEHFQRVRGTSLFLLSPLDWALIESWKNAGVPLVAVLRGIDAAFEKWRSRKSKTQAVNSLAYCAQAVLTEAQRMAETGLEPQNREQAPPFTIEELRGYLDSNATETRKAGLEEIATILDRLGSEVEQHYEDLEGLEQRLSAVEEKMIALARSRQSEEDLLTARRELDIQLRPHRGKMTPPQLAMLEKQYLERRLLESSGLPRLSLFYLV